MASNHHQETLEDARTTRRCDRCGNAIAEGDLRYVAKIQVFAAYDPLQISFEDLWRDHTRDIEQLLKQCEDMTEEELMRDVYVDFQFDLCRDCQKAYVTAPLPRPVNGGHPPERS